VGHVTLTTPRAATRRQIDVECLLRNSKVNLASSREETSSSEYETDLASSRRNGRWKSAVVRASYRERTSVTSPRHAETRQTTIREVCHVMFLW